MSRAEEIAQGLRDEHGGLIGGLIVEDYVRGIEDFEAKEPPPRMTSASYDLGRKRAAEKVAREAEVMDWINAEQERRHQAVREMLKDHPDALADYDAKIAAIRSGVKPSLTSKPQDAV